MLTRRTFLASSATTALGWPALLRGAPRAASFTDTPASSALRVLFLGGTGFLGPHMVRLALDRGHRVTLFTRGRAGTELFPEAERLIGDRHGQLDALKGKSWDVVIDNSGYVPADVRDSVQLLRGSVGHYLFTSTIDAYRDFHTANMVESAPLATLPPRTPHDPQKYYGPLKALCEEVVAELMPGKHTIVRPGWVAGPGDNNHLFSYWVMRLARGGDVLAPGTPADPVQYTDVRDLAAWVIAMVESQRGGRYHAVGPVLTFAELLHGIKATTTAPSTFTWVDAEFLRNEQVRPYFDLPLWWPPRNDLTFPNMPSGLGGGIGAFTFDGSKARAAGFTQRPLAETARDTLQWYRATFGEWSDTRRSGLASAREAALLAKWRAR